jgi:hypothetical protein
MKTMNETLRSYIRRVIKEEIDIGKVAFGGERKDKVPFEEDTPTEAKLLQNIVDYLDTSKQLSNDDISSIKSWLSSGEYSDIFMRPPSGNVYRSVAMTYEQLSKITGLSSEEITKATVGSFTRRGSAKTEYTIVSRGGGVTSWSHSINIAMNFGISERNKLLKNNKEISRSVVIFEASTENNVGSMLDVDAIYKKVDHPLMIDRYKEREVWGLGPIKCSRVAWYEDY